MEMKAWFDEGEKEERQWPWRLRVVGDNFFFT